MSAHQINFQEIRLLFDIQNQKNFEFYLERIYSDFCTIKNNVNLGIRYFYNFML